MDRVLSEEQYAAFSETDFIGDEAFQDWVLENSQASFWNRFLQHYPGQIPVVENARSFLLQLQFRQDTPGEALVSRSLAKQLAAIEAQDGGLVIPMQRQHSWRPALRIAALLAGLVLLVSVYLVTAGIGGQKTGRATEYGQLDSLVLPDGSRVVLNAHSKIRYAKEWKKGENREVWLDGEAFFNVVHLNQQQNNILPGERFVVHTDDVDIEVLGTSFNVRNRRGKTEVVLQTGKVKLSFPAGQHKEVVMQPGEMVCFNPAKQLITKEETNPTNYASWKENKLLLHNPSIHEVIAYLEDNFGKRIQLLDTTLGSRKIEGPIPVSNLDDALFIITTVYRSEIVRPNENTIVLRPLK
jgi:ferric-dicitrate binding protein FerR (iron transport regulator)